MRKVKPKNEEEEDRISRLPDNVLQHILSFMPVKQAARAGTLSPTWYRAWKSLPILNFKFVCQSEDDEEVGKRIIEFGESLSILHNHDQNAIIQSLDVSWPLFKKKYSDYINQWLDLVTSHCIKVLRINVAPDEVKTQNIFSRHKNCYLLPRIRLVTEALQVLMIRECRFPKYGIFTENPMLVCLRVICLEQVFISSEVLKDLLSRCPFLEEFTLKSLYFHDLKISKVEKLRQVNVRGMKKIEFEDLPNLQILDTDCDFRNIELKNCCNVKMLSLQIARDYMHEVVIQNLLSKLRSLETLVVEGDFCLHISSPSLKSIIFRYCGLGKPASVEIDAPRLWWYEYQGCQLPEYLYMTSQPYPIETRLVLTPHSDDTNWFVDFRKYLARLNTSKFILKLKINSCKCLLPSLELNERYLPPPTVVDSLELQHDSLSSDNTALIEGLLWCCRPITVSVEPTYEFLKVFQETLVNRDEDTMYCGDYCTFTCWRGYLKDVKVDTQDGTKEFENLQEADLYGLLAEGTLQFQFKWDKLTAS